MAYKTPDGPSRSEPAHVSVSAPAKARSADRWVRVARNARRWATTPHVVLSLILLVLLVYFVVFPLLTIVQSSFQWADSDRRLSGGQARPGEYTLFHWARVVAGPLASKILWSPLWNSVLTSVGATALAMAIGGTLAWLTVRTDMPGRRAIATLSPIPYVIPSWPLALAWIAIFKTPEIGGRPGLLESVLGVHVPVWLSYGPVPIVVCLALHFYAFTFLLLSAALATLDSRLEESAEVLGASRWTALRRITLPLMLPAVLSAVALTFSRALSNFGTSYFLGIPVRYYTLPMMIYTNMNPSTGSPGDAFVLALILILISVALIALNQRAIGTRKSYATLTGKGFQVRPTALGRWRWPAAVCCWAFLIVCVLAPIGIIVWQTFMLRDGVYGLENLTLHYWAGEPDPSIGEGEPGVLFNPAIRKAAWNSLALSSVTAVLCGLIGLLLGYSIVKGRGTRISQAVEQASFLPYVIPSIAFGAIYLSMFARPVGPIPALYGTFTLLVLVSVVSHLPFASRTGVSSMMQIGNELEEAAIVAGASWWRRFLRIILPLSVTGILSGFLLTFITTMRELALIILLVTPDTRVLTTMTFRYQEQGYPQFGNAIVVMIIVVVLAANFVVARLRRRSSALGLSV
jgi:iron(III) transport system permease protein